MTTLGSFIATVFTTTGVLVLLVVALILAAKRRRRTLRAVGVLLPIVLLILMPAAAASWLPAFTTIVSVCVTLAVAQSTRRLDARSVIRAIALRPRQGLAAAVRAARAAGRPRSLGSAGAAWLAFTGALGLTRAHAVLVGIVALPVAALAAIGHLNTLTWTATSVAATSFGLILLLSRFNPCDSIATDFVDEPGEPASPSDRSSDEDDTYDYLTDFEEPGRR